MKYSLIYAFAQPRTNLTQLLISKVSQTIALMTSTLWDDVKVINRIT